MSRIKETRRRSSTIGKECLAHCAKMESWRMMARVLKLTMLRMSGTDKRFSMIAWATSLWTSNHSWTMVRNLSIARRTLQHALSFSSPRMRTNWKQFGHSWILIHTIPISGTYLRSNFKKTMPQTMGRAFGPKDRLRFRLKLEEANKNWTILWSVKPLSCTNTS